MSHNCVWHGKYNPSVHSRTSPDPVRPCTTERLFPSPHGIDTGPYGSRKAEHTDVPMPVWNPQGPLGCPNVYGTCEIHVRYLATLWPKNMPVCMWPQHRIMTKPHPTYEWYRAVGLGEPYPWEVRMKSSFFDIMVTRAFYGLSVLFGIVRTRTSTLRVPYGASVGTVRDFADVLRIFKPRTEPVGGSQEPWTVVIRAEPYGAVKTHTRPLRVHTWLIGLCPVWNPIGNLHGPVWLSTSLPWSQNRRKHMSESCASSTFSYGLYGAHTGLKAFEKSCGPTRHVVGLPTGSLVFNPCGACKLLWSFIWPRHLSDFVRTSYGPLTRMTPQLLRARDERDRVGRERERESDSALLPNTCVFNLFIDEPEHENKNNLSSHWRLRSA